MLLKARAIGLGVLVLLVAGAVASATASAAGPYWNHRENPNENGLKISPQSPESFYGTGGPVELKGTIGGTSIIQKMAGVKVTGTIWNNSLQGQIKLRMKVTPITVVEPSLPACQTEVFSQPGAHNVIYAEGHLGWTWDGTEAQLKEQPQKGQKPDVIIIPPGTQIQQGATELPKGTFFETKFGSGCGVLTGTFPYKGSTVANPIQPSGVNEWSNTLRIVMPEGKEKQHFWNGKEPVGVETGVTFAGNPASLTGEGAGETIRQEVSISEK